ncbi:hypothetical protein Ancab_002669 [Ancistrocladus abbreviatus]
MELVNPSILAAVTQDAIVLKSLHLPTSHPLFPAAPRTQLLFRQIIASCGPAFTPKDYWFKLVVFTLPERSVKGMDMVVQCFTKRFFLLLGILLLQVSQLLH